jgi:hypothetical protein
VFFTVMMVLGQVTPRYDWVARFGSELALGRCGWAMIANFVVVGVAMAGLGMALRRATGPRRSGLMGAAAVTAAGPSPGSAWPPGWPVQCCSSPPS